MILKARKKPVEIEFLQWTGENHRDMFDFLSETTNKNMEAIGRDFYITHDKGKVDLIIRTSEGDMLANHGDYIIKEPFDKDRKYYPCKPDIFEKTYEVL